MDRNLVAFGSWRCNCTMLVDHHADVPATCPEHSVGLLGPVTYESNPNNVALGYAPAAH